MNEPLGNTAGTFFGKIQSVPIVYLIGTCRGSTNFNDFQRINDATTTSTTLMFFKQRRHSFQVSTPTLFPPTYPSPPLQSHNPGMSPPSQRSSPPPATLEGKPSSTRPNTGGRPPFTWGVN